MQVSASTMVIRCVALLLTSSYLITMVTAASTHQVARSSVRAVEMIANDVQGKKVRISMKSLGIATNEDKLSAEDKQKNADAKRRCYQRTEMILGKEAKKNKEFKMHLLTCEYREMHAMMKQEKADYEKSLREGSALNITNPYKKEYGYVTVNPHNFTFISQPEPCRGNDTILVTVHSATQYWHKRETIRQTWGNPLIFRDFLPSSYKVKLVFVLGLPENNTDQLHIDYENEQYRDILQINFRDHYYNNTYKAIYNMKWISESCPNAKLVIKTDDDISLNLRKFPNFLKNFTTQLGENLHSDAFFIGGHQLEGGPPRNPASKWYLPYKVYKYDTFPKWFQGMVYFLSPRLAKEIYKLSFTTPYIFTDDVYVGIIADRVKAINRYDLSPFYSFVYDPLNTKQLSWRFDPLVFYHNLNLYETYTLWFAQCSHISCV